MLLKVKFTFTSFWTTKYPSKGEFHLQKHVEASYQVKVEQWYFQIAVGLEFPADSILSISS